jgi:TolA-binding protein
MNMDNKEMHKGRKSLRKADFLRFHRTGKVDIDRSEYDEFSQAALHGVRYQKEDPAVVFSKMERALGVAAPPARNLNSRKILTIAASFLVLLSVAYIALFQTSTVSGEEIYNAHFSSISYVDSDLQRGTRTDGSAKASIKDKAIEAYSAEDYATAEGLFQLYLQEENPTDRTARFFYGITLLARGKVQAAIPIFKDIKNNPPVAGLQRPATYYLALSYVRQDQPEQALPHLQSLTDKQDRYGRAAKGVLKDYGL